ARADESRNFYVLEQLHVLPNVSYLAKIRNTDREIGYHEEKHLGELHEEEKAGAPKQSVPVAH
ncbi:MAG TPA: hypothetical protein VLR49_06785, partial [Ferruginibacter sp.]|nr:hypothetical protein [Ferruginibacter sp.]